MISVKATKTRARAYPLAIGVLTDRVAVDPAHQPAIDQAGSLLDQQGFTGKEGQVAVVSARGGTLLLVGIGEEASVDKLRRAAGALARTLGKLERITTTLHRVDIEGAERAVCEGLLLGGYRFDEFRSRPENSTRVDLVGADQAEVDRAELLAGAETFARDLVNTPARDKPPAKLAERIGQRAASAGLEVEIWDEATIAAEKMEGLRAVSAGSDQPPRFVRIGHRPPKTRFTLALVGKGIVFDSGGLSLKTPEYMETMKTDMAGAAAVAAAMVAIGQLGLPVRVEAFLPLTENMPGGSATRPGDVITYRNGKTIEVLNTDAEGRLVLADGLILADELGADLVVDIATLTGAARVALGDKIGAVFGTDRTDVDMLVAAGAFAGERFWPMPLAEDYRSSVDSEVADMTNTGGRYGGAINAALILKEFVGERRWLHLDVAGPARAYENYWWMVKGGTGFGTRTLVRLAEMLGGVD